MKISAFIVGPGERPPVHGQDEFEEGDGNDPDLELIREGMDPEAVLEAQRHRNGLAVVSAPTLQVKPY